MGGAVKAVTSAFSAISPYAGPIGTVFSAVSYLKQRREEKKAQKAEKARADIARRKEESAQRMEQVKAQRARVEEQRKARLRQGQILAQGGSSGLGMTGTAPMLGALGSVSSQMSSNIGDINVAEGFSQEQSGYNTAMARQEEKIGESQARASGWQQIGTMASNLPNTFGNPFDINRKI